MLKVPQADLDRKSTAARDTSGCSDQLITCIDGARQMFLDDHLVASTTLKRSFHKPRVHPQSPVLKPETPMEMNEGVNPCATMATVLYDPLDSLYKAWYMAGWDDGFAYATSHDGLSWSRPRLDVVPGTNRVLPQLPGYIRHGSTVCLDHEARDATERFKMFAFFRMGTGKWPRENPVPQPVPNEIAFIYTSPDGVHWTQRAQTGVCGDTSSMFRNPFRNTWAYSIRTFRGVLGRGRSYHEHADFVQSATWEPGDPQHWLATDALDRPDPELQLRPELYKVDCVAYEGVMLGLFAIYYGPPNHIAWSENSPKIVDLSIGFSSDGMHWNRPDRTAFIRSSREPNTWNRGYLQSSGGVCLVVEDELRFYFGAFSGVSPARKAMPYGIGTLGLAVLRRDGFASMDGPGVPMPPITTTGDRQAHKRCDLPAVGELTTRPVRFSGKHLFVNATIRIGELRVELLDEAWNVLEGYSAAECVPVTGDSTRHAVHWKTSDGLAKYAGVPVRFRFLLDAGELYAFWVSDTASGASGGYVAAGGPGFSGPRDLATR